MNQDILQGKSVKGFHLVNEVREMPQNFTQWMQDNRYRIIRAKAVPYFIKDNYRYGNVDKGLKWEAQVSKITASKKGLFDWSSREANKDGNKIYNSYDSTIKLTPKQIANAGAIKSLLGDSTEMTVKDFWDADNGIPNEVKGTTNCVNAAIANEMLRRGINVTASSKFIEAIANDKYNEVFRTAKEAIPQINNIGNKTASLIETALVKRINRGERYFLSGNDKVTSELYRRGIITKDNVEGHIISAEMTPSGLVLYDHQKESFVSIKSMLNDIDIVTGIEYLRVDNLLIKADKTMLEQLVRVRY